MQNANLKRTPLYESHVNRGGKMVAFAGWEMPVQYSGVIPEHQAVRQRGGFFDVSHMGEIVVTGPEAQAAINYLTCNDLSKLYPGKAQYNAIITPLGGVVDDIIVYKYSDERFLICVNASNSDRDFEWFLRNNRFKAEIRNASSDYGQIAVQGPMAAVLMDRIAPDSKSSELKYFHFREAKLWGYPVIIARTGYTGEDGFEIFTPWNDTPVIWDRLLAEGETLGMLPIGLGARDSLRLEACYPLHGHELSEEISAIESGLGWIVKLGKGDFIGREVLEKQVESGSPRSLAAFMVEDAGIVRQGDPIFRAADGSDQIGAATSGTKTPTLNRALGLALITSGSAKEGESVFAEVRGKRIRCRIVKKPFYSVSGR